MQAACTSFVLKSSSRSASCLRLRLYHRTIPLCIAQPRSPKHDRDPFSKLGLRSNRPPDSSASSKSPQRHGCPHLSDQDWEIRTGRAIYVLQQTLPEFFFTGLVTSMDKATGIPRSSATSRSIPVLNANPLDYQVYADDDDVEGIYSPKVGLCYTPPVALPPPFPATLHIEGLPLYLASAVFIRHTLNALYVDLKLELRKCIVNTPRLPTSASMSAPTSILGPTTTPEPTPMPWQKQNPKNKRGSSREKSLVVGFCVTGTSRVSGAPAEWEVTSTYTFSPLSGLIDKHIINSIYPAPHQAVYDALRTSLGKVFGFGMEGEEQGLQERRQEGAGAAACAAAAGIGINTRVGGGCKEVKQ
ncbi:hypothetical protein J132_08752 [Termitomyces sp. J132]|nr:hypothetical protein H2248_002579 [Termitomyces sp. 'cryptogamus']KNZ79749.1 hypothetical protein J132_08752 [Termitomyces sp. J132]